MKEDLDSNVNFLQKMYGLVFNSRFNGSFDLLCRRSNVSHLPVTYVCNMGIVEKLTAY